MARRGRVELEDWCIFATRWRLERGKRMRGGIKGEAERSDTCQGRGWRRERVWPSARTGVRNGERLRENGEVG